MAEFKSTNAAVKALKHLEDQLTCAVCLDHYKDPKQLSCFHIFCKQCLVKLVVQDQQGQLSVRCPTCRRSTLLPATCVSGLQSAFHIQHLFEIKDAIEKVKEPQETIDPTSIENLEGEVNQVIPPMKVTYYCQIHKEEELKLYCETCGEVICFHCTINMHNGHRYDLVSEVYEKYKSEIIASLEPVEAQLGDVNEALEQLDARHEQITDQRAVIEAEIHKTIQRLHQALDVRKTELISQLDHMTQQKLKKLAAQRDGVEMMLAQLNSCLEFVRESLRTGSQEEVVNMKKPVVKLIKEIIAGYKHDTLEVTETANISFFVSLAPKKACQEFGKVYLQQVSPIKSYATGSGLERAVPGERATAVLHAIDSKGVECENPIENVNCGLVSVVNREKTKCRVNQLKKNQYEISYQLTTRGRHHLYIKVNGECIKGSPFTVMVKLPVQKLGTPIKTIGGLNTPWGVAVNKRGEIIVAECEGHCISIFYPSGFKLRKFGFEGSRHGKFKHPCGVAVDEDDYILVADRDNSQIKKFTSEGEFIKAVGRKGSRLSEFTNPIGIAIHPHNKKMYVSDSSNHRVQILSPNLTVCYYSFGNYGSGNGEFNNPVDLAFDNTGNVYVADSNNHRIQVFTANGQFSRKFGTHGRGNGELNWPSSIAIDPEDMVYVTEWYNHRVSVFTCEGQFLTSFGTRGNGPGKFITPCGIAVDENGIVYVSDSHNHCVQLF